jgi:hypothetical protein
MIQILRSSQRRDVQVRDVEQCGNRYRSSTRLYIHYEHLSTDPCGIKKMMDRISLLRSTTVREIALNVCGHAGRRSYNNLKHPMTGQIEIISQIGNLPARNLS